MSKEFLTVLREHECFATAIKFVESHRPVVPRYSPGGTKEEEEQIIRKIKHETARQDGFDLALRLLTGEKNV